jgi:hypothetical protein
VKLTKKNLSIILSLSLASVMTLAITAGQNIELSRFLNGRGGPNFRSTARNIEKVLPTGTRVRIDQVKPFTSGNSGLHVTVTTDGADKDKKFWIYFNKNSPGMKLVNADGTTTEIPARGGRGQTTRPVVATPGGPAVIVPAPAPAPAPPAPAPVPAPPAPVPVPAPPVPAPLPVPSPAVSATIGAGLGAVGGLNGGGGMTPPCSDCAGAGSGIISPSPTPLPVAPPAVIPAPAVATTPSRAGTHIEVSSEDGLYIQNAEVKCSYRDLEFPRNPQIYPGTIDVKIENYNVTRLDAQIDGCRVQLGDYRQIRENTINLNGVERVVQIPPRSIVLKNAAGCEVVFSVDQKTRGSSRPTMNFGWVAVGGSPCARQCPNSLRKFWQVDMDPNRQICH